MTCKTGQMSVPAFVRTVSTFSNPKTPRPLGGCRWK